MLNRRNFLKSIGFASVLPAGLLALGCDGAKATPIEKPELCNYCEKRPVDEDCCVRHFSSFYSLNKPLSTKRFCRPCWNVLLVSVHIGDTANLDIMLRDDSEANLHNLSGIRLAGVRVAVENEC